MVVNYIKKNYKQALISPGLRENGLTVLKRVIRKVNPILLLIIITNIIDVFILNLRTQIIAIKSPKLKKYEKIIQR